MYDSGIYLVNGTEIVPKSESGKARKLTGKGAGQAPIRKGTIVYSILEARNTSGDMEHLELRFDSMASHDITFVGIVQTAKAPGMEKFPILYVLTDCHNTLCTVGGTISEDDHMFGLSAAKKYGGICAPPHTAVIHQYVREMMAECGRAILGSGSHTHYGALETMATGEGDGELVKQLLKDIYDMAYLSVITVHLNDMPWPGTGPQDIALAIIGAMFKSGYAKNKVMEFVGPGVASMTIDYRNGVGVMATEATCLPSIWKADDDTKAYLTRHHREEDYKELTPTNVAYYDGCVYVDLPMVKPMIALSFHLSNTYEIDELRTSLNDILGVVEAEAARASGGKASFTLRDKIQGGQPIVQQVVITGCVNSTYSNMTGATRILKGRNCGYDEFSLTVYPSSQPVFADLVKEGAVSDLMDAGAIIQTVFCDPRFGVGDTPCNNGLSIRHTTRNFPNKEGSKPDSGQMAAAVLMDVRSIVAMAANGGKLTSAQEMEGWGNVSEYEFDGISYRNQVYVRYNKDDGERELVYGPNIKDWPEMSPLADNILLRVCSKIMDPVTTTDELILSGETSSYRSNSLGLTELALSRRDPEYMGRTKEVDSLEGAGVRDDTTKGPELEPALEELFDAIRGIEGDENVTAQDTEVGSMIYVVRPGDESAREQAVNCQRVISGPANICEECVTKRYRPDVVNWGMVPFQMKEDPCLEIGDYTHVPGVRKALDGGLKDIKAYALRKEGGNVRTLDLYIADITAEGRGIVEVGCLINYNRGRH